LGRIFRKVRSLDQTTIQLSDLEGLRLSELYELAKKMDISGYTNLRKRELIFEILKTKTEHQGHIFVEGVLEVMPDGFGFIRQFSYLPSDEDIYVSPSQIRKFDLRTGDKITGQARPPKDSERYFALLRIEAVNGGDPDNTVRRAPFHALTPIFPDERYSLETANGDIATRLLDLVAPVGRGQRGLIVSPPKAGKTVLLKTVANSLTENYPDMTLMVLLIDERPEEVTDMQRSVDGEVLASTFDKMPENHVKLADMVLERAQRLVEHGKDVVVLMDSITRLARAHNLVIPSSGRTLSGGLDPSALHRPKKFFGAARNIEEGGSLTIMATALIDTGSRMDDVIYEEFKGTGNLEVHLDRRLADRRIFPAIDVKRSGTRKEELLLTERELEVMWRFRKSTADMDSAEVIEEFGRLIRQTKSNEELLEILHATFG